MALTQEEAQRLQQIAMSDPRIAGIVAKFQSMPGAARGSQGGQLLVELQQALRANPTLRAAGLGDASMGEEYSFNPRTGGVSISPGEWDDFAKHLLVGAAMAAGGYALGSVLPAATSPTAFAASEAAAAGALGPASGGVAPAGFGLGPAAAGGAAATTTATTAAAAAPKFIDRIKDAAPALAGLGAAGLSNLAGGGDGGSSLSNSGVTDEIMQSMALARKRMEQAQPVYDTLVNMAYGSTPVRSRGAAPAGYTPNAAPSGAYQYQSPRFGGN